jgi:hypothetical protein
MLLKRRPPGIESTPVELKPGLEHLDQKAVAVLRWLNANKVDYVLVGPVAAAVRGEADSPGPVAIVPSPYARNYERLSTALAASHARLRIPERRPGSSEELSAIKLTPEKLSRGSRWMLRCESYDIDIEARAARRAGAPPGAPRYQELLYEAGRFELALGLSVEAASPEDLELYAHMDRTGSAPEIRITRMAPAEHGTAEHGTAEHGTA